MKNGFIYIWMDTEDKKFYIGSHSGREDDKYIGSGIYFINAYNKRPNKFKRRILERVLFVDYKDLLQREEYWLNMIDESELGIKYYNLKKCASGGNIIGNLSIEKQEQHRKKSILARKNGWIKWYQQQTPEEKSKRGKLARSCVKCQSGGSMPGETNPFFGKKHTEETRRRMSEIAKKRKKPSNIKKYTIIFPNGEIEIYSGKKEIEHKFNSKGKIKFSSFIDTNKPIKSNRKSAKNHPLIGAKIFSNR